MRNDRILLFRIFNFKAMPKYHSIDNIPAKVFFQILESNDFQLLKPKPKEKDLEKIFLQIYDDFFVQSENHQAKAYLETRSNFYYKKQKVEMLIKLMQFYVANQTTVLMRSEMAEVLKVSYGLHFDPNGDVLDQVHKIMTFDVPIMKNELVFLETQLNELSKGGGKEVKFFDQLAVMSQHLPNNSLLNENMTLATYVALNKLIWQNSLKS